MTNGIGRVGWRNYVSAAPTTASIITTGLVLNLDASNPLSYSGTGTTWTDLSGNGNNGTLVNGTGYSSSNGGTMVFDGVNDNVTINNSTLLDSQTITIESWAYLNGTLNQAAFIFEKGYVNTQYSNFFYSDGMFLFRTQGLSNLDLKITSSSYMSANAWNHIICTYALGVKSIYVNGVLANQITGVTGTIPSNSGGIFLGCYHNGPFSTNFYLNGKIAISRAYNIALTSTQVQQNFNAEKARFGFTNYTTRTTAFATATGITDTTILNALNTFDTGLISNGLDTKMKALYPFVGGTANTHKYNFMNPTNFQITWNGGVSHSSSGVLFNGTNGYANTNFNQLSNMSLNNQGLTTYNNLVDASSVVFGYSGIFNAGISVAHVGFINNNGNITTRMSSTGGTPLTHNVNYNGMVTGNRTLSNQEKLYKNGVLVSTSSNNSTSLQNFNYYIGALNNAGSGILYPYNVRKSLFAIHEGLTDVEASTFYNLVQAFQTSLSRQV
jgi:hypothetical protein